MSNYAVANRYAEALIQIAEEKGTLETMNNELQLVKAVIDQTPSFLELIQHPKVTKEQKLQIINENFSNAVSKEILNTLSILIERKRTDIIVAMINKFDVLSNEIRGVAKAKVVSVKALSEEEKALISETFAKKVGKNTLFIENEINPDLIGGIKIRIGDRIYDGSVKGQLDRLQRQLVASNR